MEFKEQSFANKEEILKRILPLLRKITHKDNYPLDKGCQEWLLALIYLYVLAFNSKVAAPLSIQKSESPDFIINGTIGLEIAAVTDERVRKKTAFNEKKGEPTIIPASGNERETRAFTKFVEQIEKKSKLTEKYKSKHPQLIAIKLLGSIEWPYSALLTEELNRHLAENQGVWADWHNTYMFDEIAALKVTMGNYSIFLFHEGRYELLEAPNLGSELAPELFS